ncbi:MAG: hypothetical protein QM523_08070 [Candidatus Pacebacteria bacterium]|nr:hypothetical protein [Candidatus Paceibacterota bacterium]
MTNLNHHLKYLVRLALLILGLGGGVIVGVMGAVAPFQTAAAVETPQSIPQVQKPEIPTSNNRANDAAGTVKTPTDSGPIGAAAPVVNSTATPSGPENLGQLFSKGEKGQGRSDLSDSDDRFGSIVESARLAAQAGDIQAQYRYGAYLYNGVNLTLRATPPKDKSAPQPRLTFTFGGDRASTVEWWQKSAIGGNAMAAEALAEYYSPSGPEPVRYKSLVWYLKSAQLGYASAQQILGVSLIALSNDPVERKKFINQFPKLGSPAYDKILEIIPDFTDFPTSSKELYALGFGWLKRSSDAGYYAAQRDLAIELNNERAVNFDRDEAYRLFDILVEKRETIVYLHYALSLINDGRGREDFQKAADLLQRAIDMGEHRAYRGLAVINARGLGVPASPSKAFLYITKCAELALDYCGDVLASGYSYGSRTLGIRQDLDQAFYWARKLALAGLPSGYQYLSSLYFTGTKERPKNIYLAYLYRRMMGRDDDLDGFQNSQKLYLQLTPEQKSRANEFLVKWKPSDPLPE